MIHKNPYSLPTILSTVLFFSLSFIKMSWAIDSDLKEEISKPSKLGSFVLVRSTAHLFDRIPESSNPSKGSKWTHQEHRLNQGFVAHLIELAPSWAKVAIGQQTNQKHCLSEHTQGKNFYLEVYVHRDDLIPIVKTKTTQKFSDGTELTIWPGLPLFKQSQLNRSMGTYKIHASHFSFTTNLAQNTVGLSWKGIELNATSSPDFMINTSATLQLDKKASIPLNYANDLILVSQVSQTPQKALVQFDESCLRIRVLVARGMVTKAQYAIGTSSGGIGFAGTGFGSSNRSKYTLKKGVRLKWQNGRPAGYLRKDYVVGQGQIITNSGHEMCFKVRMSFAFNDAQPLIVCAHSEKK